MRGQSLTDGRIPPFSYITHATMAALYEYFERAEEAKLSTGIALYMGIAYLLSTEERDGLHQGSIEKTRGEIGEAGGVSATNVTRYSQHLVSAEVLELEQLVAGGANLYRWALVEPPFQAPHQIGEAGGSPPQDGDTPHQIGEAFIGSKKTDKKTTTPCSPPEGDAEVLQKIFDFWREQTGRNGSTKFDPKRQRAIKARLREDFTTRELCLAIVGCTRSDWHMKRGRHANRDGEVKTELTLILRDAPQVEKLMKLAGDTVDSGSRPDVTESAAATTTWEQAKDRLRTAVPESTYLIWLDPLEIAGERDNTLVLLDTQDKGAWTLRRYKGLILEAVQAVTADYTAIELIDHTGLELEQAA
jgi:hypothetical protein